MASRPDGAPRRGSISTATSKILATAHRATALLALRPEESTAHRHPPGGMSGSADRRDAPTTSTMDFGPTVNGHGTTKDYVSGANASLPDASRTFNPPSPSLPVGAIQADGGIEGVAARALDTLRAEGTTGGGIALRAPGPLPPRPVPRTAE